VERSTGPSLAEVVRRLCFPDLSQDWMDFKGAVQTFSETLSGVDL